VLRHRILISAALAGSVAVALAPISAEAATPASSAGARQLSPAKTAAATSLSQAAGFKTYSTSAGKSFRLQKSVAADMASAVSRTAATTASGTTIYSLSGSSCSTETGNGTEASPYCSLQDAVNAAASGDTIDVGSVYSGTGSPAVTITTSGLTLVGTTDVSWVDQLTLDGASDVKISNMIMSSGNPAALVIENSSGITLDSDFIGGSTYPGNGVSIDGASGNVTISRSFLDTKGWGTGLTAVDIAAGAKNVDLASNVISNLPITATGVSGLDIVGNTILPSCAGAVDIEGSSTGISIENNVVEVAQPQSSRIIDESYCLKNGYGWAPNFTVAALATAGTTSEYNYFDPQPTEANDPYSWGGTSYGTIAAFQAATGQGAHDLDEVSTFDGSNMRFPDGNFPLGIVPTNETPVNGTANANAPGALSSDYYGVAPYNTRGAVQFTGPNPNLAVSFSVVDSGAFSVTLTYKVTGDTTLTSPEGGMAVYWGDGESEADSFSPTGTGTIQHTYHDPGTYTITGNATDGKNDYASNSVSGVQTAGSEYTPYGPVRILDTRIGLGSAKAAMAPNGTLKLKVVGAGTKGATLPSGITAVVLNVTVTQPSAGGHLTVYGDETATGAAAAAPGTSNLNFSAGETVPNLVVAPVGPNGVVDFDNAANGTTHVVADVSGYFTQQTADEYVSITPLRVLDTRKAIGTSTVAKIPANGNLTLQIEGANGHEIPTAGVTAAALNLTVTNPARGGVLTAYPAGESLPTVSNLNFSAGETVANMAMVPLGTSGDVVFHNSSSGSVDLVADLFGYFTATPSSAGLSGYIPLSVPERILDTRKSGGPLPANTVGYAPFTQNSYITAAVLNATVTQPTGGGFLAVYPFNPDNPSLLPTTSNLNFVKGQTVPNLVIAPPGSVYDSTNNSYDFGLYFGGSGSTHVILDVFGVFETT
jgi:hypothetical protein